MEQTKIAMRSGVKVHEANSESLRQMWKANLSDAERAVFMVAGIFPFLNAVTYQCSSALCAAVIDFMVDGQLTVGDNRMQITEEHIREATGLPIAGISVSPSRVYDRDVLTLRHTGSKMGATPSGLLLDRILDPSVQFACKFLAGRLLGVKTPGTIPFKYVAAAVDVSKGVCFNWCEFVKERMLEQIVSVQKGRSTSFNYPTILQFLALKAFGEVGIPRSDISDADPGINTYTVLRRADVVRRKRGRKERKAAGAGVSSLVVNIMEYHGHRVGQGPDNVEIILSREAEITNLKSQNERLQQENTRLEAALQQEIQTNASSSKEKVELERRIASLTTARGQFLLSATLYEASIRAIIVER